MYNRIVRKLTLFFLLFRLATAPAEASEEHPIRDFVENVFGEVRAVLSKHTDDRKTLYEVSQEAWQGFVER